MMAVQAREIYDISQDIVLTPMPERARHVLLAWLLSATINRAQARPSARAIAEAMRSLGEKTYQEWWQQERPGEAPPEVQAAQC